MAIEFHLIWREQIEAASAIRREHGEEAAFDYIVGEKLVNYAEAAEGRPEFSRELPRFVAAIRGIFSSDSMRTGLKRLARYLEQEEADIAEMLHEKQGTSPAETAGQGNQGGEDDDDFDNAETLARRLQFLAGKRKRFEFLRELLVAARLGTA
jgi:ubiquinone biosynthesis protein UbiJ